VDPVSRTREGFRRPAAKGWCPTCREPDLYPPEFRREAIELLRQGRTPGEPSKSLDRLVSIHRAGHRQDALTESPRVQLPEALQDTVAGCAWLPDDARGRMRAVEQRRAPSASR